jgi:hypothetical protein
MSANAIRDTNDPRRETPSTGATRAIEIKNIIHTWSITESIKSGSVKGKVKIYDAIGLFYTLPIKGQELISINYKDFEGIERQEQYVVYAVTDIRHSKVDDDSMLEYVLHFISLGKFIAERFRIRRCIKTAGGDYPPISEQVDTIYEDYYKDVRSGLVNEKELEVTNTTGPAQIVIPNMTPEEAMHLFSRKAYSAEYPSQTFRFFENRDKFFFVNMEELMSGLLYPVDDKIFFFNSGAVNVGDMTGIESAEQYLRRRQNIIELDMGSLSTMDAVKGGGYHRRVREADVLNRVIDDTDYEYYDNYQQYVLPDGQGGSTPHYDQDYVNKHLNYPVTDYILKDYVEGQRGSTLGYRPYPHYKEILPHKKASLFHYTQKALTVRINGYNDIVAGRVIEIDLPQFIPEVTERDEPRNGRYLVESVTNEFLGKYDYTQVLKLVKAGTRS